MDPAKIKTVMEAAEYKFREDRMAGPAAFPELRPSQWEQVQIMYDSDYWHRVFVIDWEKK